LSQKCAHFDVEANLTPRKLNLFGLEILDMDSMTCQFNMMLTSSSKLNKFHGATLNVGGSQVLQLSLSPNKDFMLKTQCNKRILKKMDMNPTIYIISYKLCILQLCVPR